MRRCKRWSRDVPCRRTEKKESGQNRTSRSDMEFPCISRATRATKREDRIRLSYCVRPSLHPSRDGTCGTSVHRVLPSPPEICLQRKRRGRSESAAFRRTEFERDLHWSREKSRHRLQPLASLTARPTRARTVPSDSAGRNRETPDAREPARRGCT